ncbi:MAG: response regulator [Spirochaetales bacterium]
MAQTILHVEDDRLEALITSAALAKLGFAVLQASSGLEALGFCRQGVPFDLVLMDIDLRSQPDGSETARLLLLERQVPLVFLSAHSDHDFIDRIEQISHYGFVSKPFPLLVLKQTLKAAFRLFTMQEERARLVAELQRRNEVIELVTENIADGLIHSNSKFEIDYASGPYLTQLGLPPGLEYRYDAKAVAAKIHPDDRQQTMDRIFAAIGNKEASLTYEFRVKHTDGHYFYRQDNARFLYDNGAYRESYVICRDITKQKQAELAALERERLSAIGEATSSVAHDFNNVLQAIASQLDLTLLAAQFPDAYRGHLTTAKTLVHDASQRIRPLQRWASGRSEPLELTTLDLKPLLEEVVDQTRALWEGRGGSGSVELELRLESVLIDANAGALRSAFYNLVKNAIEAMPQGGGLTLECAKVGLGAVVTVRDTGVGMDEATRKKLFLPFFSTKGAEEGRGLGMSSVRSVLDSHGATIRVVASTPEQGTHLEAVFPLAQLSSSRAQVGEPALGATRGPLEVLWVDDDEMIATAGQEMVELLGHRAQAAFSGTSALELLSKQAFDLVITDLGMPDLDGWLLAEQVGHRDPNTKVVVLTGWGEALDPKLTAGRKVFAILSKPCPAETLRELLDRVSRL